MSHLFFISILVITARNTFCPAAIIQSWWSIVAAVILFFVSLYVINKLRNGYLDRKHKQLEFIINQRTRALIAINKQLNEQLILNQEQTAELKKSNQQLIKLNSTKDKFFSIIAHDLKNPFHVTMGFTEMLLEEYQNLTPEKIKKFISLINTSSKTGNALLDNLLQWSRSQSGEITFEPTTIDLLNLCENTLLLLEADVQQKKLHLTMNIEPFITVFADENMLKTILRNLLSNAIKFSYPEGIITLSASTQRSTVEISISDSGIGISEENMKKLFELKLKTTTKGTSNESGTGLGLIICKEFIELHQGTLQVQSIPNQGTDFKVTLPLA